MRHNKKFNHLSRTSAHRKIMLSNMASSLIESKRITTTVAKAKALRVYVEPLITKAKNDTTHSRRIIFRYLQNKNAVSELFRDVAVKVGDRPGGYTRILRTGTRLGDSAEMCIIELVDYNEAMLASKAETEKPKRRRSRRGGGAKKTQPATAEAGQKKQVGGEKPDVEKEEKSSVEKKSEKSKAAEGSSGEQVENPAEKSDSSEPETDNESSEDKKEE